MKYKSSKFFGSVRSFLLFLIIVLPLSYAHATTNNSWVNATPAGTSGYVFNTVATIGNYVYLGTDHGVYKSTDGGTTWNQTNAGLTGNMNVTSIAIGWVVSSGTYQVDANSPVFVGTSDGVFATSTIGGSSWDSSSPGWGSVNDLEIDQSQAMQGSFTNLYAATTNGVYISTNSGSTWTLDSSGLSGRPATKLVTDYGNNKIYVLSNNKMYGSALYSANSNTPESWSQVFDGSGSTLNDVSMLNDLGNIEFVATSSGVYKSDQSGANLSTVNVGLPGSSVSSIANDYQDNLIAYVAIPGSGVYRTVNEAGATANPQWLPINPSLSDLDIKEVKTDPTSSMVVYAIGANGLYKLTYSGTPENIDLTPPSAISDLVVGPIVMNSFSGTPYGTVSLSWTAPGDNGTYGEATAYEIRYSTQAPITNSTYSNATLITALHNPVTDLLPIEPTPHISGYHETYNVNLPNTNQTFYFAIKSFDAAGNVSAISNDSTPPSISSGSPSGSLSAGTTQTTLSVATDENATCKYSTTANTVYASISNIFTTTGGMSHQSTISGLSNGNSYTYYIRCIDTSNNANLSDYTVSFSVATGNVGVGGVPSGGGNPAPSGTPRVIPGCGNRTTGFSSITTESCANNIPSGGVPIPGCGNRTTGFSSIDGRSCVGNVAGGSSIPGCGNRTTGFSSVNGKSCVGNVGSSSRIYDFGTLTLRLGSKGEAVKELQRFLNDTLNLGLVIDGKLGPKTIVVMKKWQQAHNLVPDGLIGVKTKAMMNASVQ